MTGVPLTWSERAELASDVGPDPRFVGAILSLADAVPLARLRERVTTRALDVPSLRRVLVDPGGRPHWLPAAGDLGSHVDLAPLDGGPLAATAGLLCRDLDPRRPLWQLTLVADPDDPPGAGRWLVVRVHHAVADGPTAIAEILHLLADIPVRAVDDGGALSSRHLGTAGFGRSARWMPPGVGLVAALAPRSPRTSLLRPIAPGCELVVLRLDLEAVHAAGRRAGGTVNDVLLAAVALLHGALARERGERLRHVTVSVPVMWGGSRRRRNTVGLLRVAVPAPATGETATSYISRIAARTRRRKALLVDDSPARLTAPVTVALARLGLLRPLMARQRQITTLLTNVHGPVGSVEVCGSRVRTIVPLTPAAGNIPVVAAALSYGTQLVLTLRIDPTALSAEGVRRVARAAVERVAPGSLRDDDW
ncbi:DUF1298 domain-containing protein [Miniimonas arenae]|uniref:DUF1298 domain-containing protein n=1 Tax=Miniimonas arenae TaxID=676201 RepID=A0A5C5BB53_9MICO|nr:WS/DGAT domain-containing protein [Miniimonas arenae]TNU73195.1 DUF1298 domain-containing protein [Miniimonas arenae]